MNAVRRPHELTERYRKYGDQLPDKDTLLRLNTDMSRYNGRVALTHAHVCIDVAAHYGESGETGKVRRWLGRAKDISADLIQDTVLTSPSATESSLADNRAGALVTLAQIPLWEAIILNDSDKVPSTKDLLHISEDLAHTAQFSKRATTITVEFTDLVLGLRGIERGGHGWLARTALRREDCRRSAKHDVATLTDSHNWDTGHTYSSFYPMALKNPPHKVQYKMDESTASSYSDSISVVAARGIGLNNARNILASCRAEAERREAIMSSDELDDVTSSLYFSFSENKPAIFGV